MLRIRLKLVGEELVLKKPIYNPSLAALRKYIVQHDEGHIASSGALVCRTGAYVGRAPRKRYLVDEAHTRTAIDWGQVNQPFDEAQFTCLAKELLHSLGELQCVYVRDVYACAASNYRVAVRIISNTAYHNLFARNMFLPADEDDAASFVPQITVLVNTRFTPRPKINDSNTFVMIHLSAGLICVGGTGYTGEVKKGVFSLLNYRLPDRAQVLTMHCGANMASDQKPRSSALFFGLSGTGKTTLSSDPKRLLIGDDEHAWDERGVFNLEGGCYAKVIDLQAKQEPMIWKAIRPGALLENTPLIKGTNRVDYTDRSITENTRVSYPLTHLPNAMAEQIAPHPDTIFFLSCDAFGVLPPLALLDEEQCVFYFTRGYSAKIAGTEQGIIKPQPVFSAGFGAPFFPLPIQIYAALLKQKIRRHRTKVWLVNTGWIGGSYGTGKRMRLGLTRALIDAVLKHQVSTKNMQLDPVFGLRLPRSIPQVPSAILLPQNAWQDKQQYLTTAQNLYAQLKNNDG